MRCWAHAFLVAVAIACGVLPTSGRAAEQRRPACLSQGDTRDALAGGKTVPPFRAVAAALRGGPGESVGIRLCKMNSAMVYDVAILKLDGRLVHVLVDAGTGVPMPPREGQ